MENNQWLAFLQQHFRDSMRRPSFPSLTPPQLRPSPAACSWFLSLARKALSSLLVLWRLMWHALFCFKVFWELMFHFMQEVSTTLGSRLESCSDACKGDGTRKPVPEPEQPGAGLGTLQETLQQLQDASSASQEQLVGLEAEVRHVSRELCAEKLLWSSRYLELLREQQELRERLQAWGRSLWPKDPLAMQSNAEAPSADGLDGWCTGDSGRGLSMPSGEQARPAQLDPGPCCALQDRPASSCSDRAAASSALAGFIPPPSSASVDVGSTRLRRAQQQPGTRASAPRSPRDLRLGHRVKVLLQAGAIGVGTVRHLGFFPDQAECAVGVELEAPGPTGHSGFPCKPGHGALVPFSKVLLVWDQAPTVGTAGQPRWRDTVAGSEGTACAQGWDHGAHEAPGRRAQWD